MLTDYIKAALSRGRYELIDDGTFHGEIPGFRGVWASAKSLDLCHNQLQQVLEDWLVVNLKVGRKIPRLPGIKPFPTKLKTAH